MVKDGLRKARKDRQLALKGLSDAVKEYRKFTDQPLTLRRSDHAGRPAGQGDDRAGGQA
jgi:hypothetical protein